MEDLFSANLSINNREVAYHVVFENDQYTFRPQTQDADFQMFSLKRENDEWHPQQELPPDLSKQAIDVLEKYLLRQH